MRKPPPIFLFDIDGVLVEPRGYQAAFQATVRHFTRQMGLPDELTPDEDDIALFEANRVTSEWDSVPLTLAILFDRFLSLCPDADLPGEVSPACAAVNAVCSRNGNTGLLRQVHYRPSILQFGELVEEGKYQADVALRHARRTPGQTLFPYLGNHPLLTSLLANSRDVERSATTRIFQHFSLGSQVFEKTYGLLAELETPSLLLAYDRPLLPPELRDRLLSAQDQGRVRLAAYTMRPSRPPAEITAFHPGYAPEAEMALELAGLSELPLIAYGRIRYLAEQRQAEPESFLKPSPVQALAAILAAELRAELPALELALQLYRGEVPREGLRQLEGWSGLQVHVFEDSVGGIQATHRAAQVLREHGVEIGVHAWGCATHPEKIAALERIAAPVFSGVQPAVESALIGL